MYSSAVPDVPDRAQLIDKLQDALGVDTPVAEKILNAFDDFVSRPLESNLAKLTGRDLARRNPMIYTARGMTTVDAWVDQVLADKETSAIEAHLGTWMEEVSRIVSGGFKPGSGVDLQREQPDDPSLVELYAIQSAPNTKNSGSRRSDVNALRAAAAVLRLAGDGWS
jgi:Type II restriction endonuclease EcoO109I